MGYGFGRQVAAVSLGWDTGALDVIAQSAFGVRQVAKNIDAGGAGNVGWNVFLDLDIVATHAPIGGVQPVFSLVTQGAIAGDYVYGAANTFNVATQNPMEWTIYVVRANTGHAYDITLTEALLGVPWRLLVTFHQLGTQLPPIV